MSQHHTLLLGLGLLSIFFRPVSSELKAYVVYMGAQTFDPDMSEAQLNQVTDSHHDILASTLGRPDLAARAIIHSYRRVINGFAAVLDEQDAAKIAQRPGVVSIFPNEAMQLQTTHSWEFMALENKGTVNPSSLWTRAWYGEDVIIASLDSGIWPESRSFTDEGFGPIPGRWRGGCENNPKYGVACNKKLIGASFFNKGYFATPEIYRRSINVSSFVNSTRDIDGHGTHTLSTAGGNFVPNASVLGFNAGTAKGGASQARLAAYKVCWPSLFVSSDSSCIDSDILQGFVHAILDGVDLIFVSIGGKPRNYLSDGLAIGSFTAVKAGIVVVCAGGNQGPHEGSVSNTAPWIITVAASTTDREFQSFVELGSGSRFKGLGLARTLPESKLYPLISGTNARQGNASSFDALRCLPNTLDPEKVKDNILVCLRGNNSRREKAQVAISAGAAGMILCNDQSYGNDLTFDSYVLPATLINYADGQAVFTYVNNTKNPVAYITPTTATTDVKPSPTMADFSGRGPNTITPEILKVSFNGSYLFLESQPDITAPGVRIIAANTETQTNPAADELITPYIMLSGTSMACPHVAGVVTLLKKVYPDWSPAAIKSAIMTTARTKDNMGKPIRDHEMKQATPFSYGAGHINPNRVMDPGLVYDLTTNDYLDFLCATGVSETTVKSFAGIPYQCPKSFSLMDFNYPSISALNISSTATATRKVKNVGSAGTYKAKVVQPVGILITVEPIELKFDKVGEERSFKVIFTAKENNLGLHYVFGKLTWSDGKHSVKSPIVATVLST